MTESEFEKLFREHFAMLSNLAASVVKDSDAAKDIVQQVFLKLWQKKDELSIRGPIIPYLCRAVINTAFNEISKTKNTVYLDNHPELSNLSNSESDSFKKKEKVGEQVRVAIEALPPVCRKVFSMSRFTDLTNKEIANELNISVKAVEKHISKAYKILRVQLKPLLSAEYVLFLFVNFYLNFCFQKVGFLIF